MQRKRLKFLLLGVGIVASMAFLLIVGMNRPGGMAYYLTVSEFVATPDRVAEEFRISGKVANGTIDRMPSGREAQFVLTDGSAFLPVVYRGQIPDAFVDGADVVVEGSQQEDGTFRAHMLLAKCPSKYEAAEEEAPGALAHPDDIPRS
jgi:cytochrome c-type biogenesis protein CcmE